ncbi:MAG: SDR family oxidoreductase [Verrucomicrobia bacterium]|nr:SDR family oxidoreductase [Verrucomicrobiota bacterium]MBU6446339.1 SDR family oxidoreductase [Verrucomicrobiota bacterium]MDE3047350.1 SDR family oxidoreductase [Verrucomicrobiota bacterium]
MNIVIIGCGYIGMEAAAIWKKKGLHVTSTTRHPERLDALSKVSQKSVILKEVGDAEELVPLIADNEVIVVTIGADSPDQYESAYLNTAQLIRHLALEMDMPRHLIYTSSTSVYGDHKGQWVDETSELLATSDQGKILIETEQQYLSLEEIGWTPCILRLAEIYGPGRELSRRVKQFHGHVLPGSGDHYTNMVHEKDCASALDYALRHHLEGIYNLSDDEHPTRKELYDAISQKFQLPKVKWDPTHTPLHTGNKRVSNHKIKAEGFAFQFPHRVLD